jgi:hypothetical protein
MTDRPTQQNQTNHDTDEKMQSFSVTLYVIYKYIDIIYSFVVEQNVDS